MLDAIQTKGDKNLEKLIAMLTRSLKFSRSDREREAEGSSGNKDSSGKEKEKSDGPSFASG